MLTVDPYLQAYRPARLSGVQLSCPKPTGDLYCEQVSYAPWATLGPPTAAVAAKSESGGGSGLVIVLIVVGVIVVALGVFIVIRRRRREREAIEV